MDYRLQKLEKDSIDIIRKAKNGFKNIAVLGVGGKESIVCLYLCKRAFFGRIPFQVLQLNNVEEAKKEIAKYNLEAIIVPAKDFDCCPGCSHILKIYPFLGWSESDICLYIKENNIPVDKNTKEDLKKFDGQSSNAGSEDKEKEEIMRRLRDLGYM